AHRLQSHGDASELLGEVRYGLQADIAALDVGLGEDAAKLVLAPRRTRAHDSRLQSLDGLRQVLGGAVELRRRGQQGVRPDVELPGTHLFSLARRSGPDRAVCALRRLVLLARG